MRREGVGVFPGKNQSCSPCRETPRTGGDYADYDAMSVYERPLDEALPWERTCRRPSCGVATRRDMSDFEQFEQILSGFRADFERFCASLFGIRDLPR